MKKRELKREVTTLQTQNARLTRVLSIVTLTMTVANLWMTIAKFKSKQRQQEDGHHVEK